MSSSRLFTALGLVLLLPACSGFGTFLDDAYGYHGNEHEAIGDSENVRRVKGEPVIAPPIETEPGNVWPGPIPVMPTLSDLERAQEEELQRYRATTPVPKTNIPPPPAGTSSPEAGKTSGNDLKDAIVIPNGDGTSTVIMPDGSVRTIPTPKSGAGAGGGAARSTDGNGSGQ